MNVAPDAGQFHYDLMAAALRYIETRRGEQPSLEEVAAAIGLSPAHFQRVFSQWVGVSPKRYLQHLTLDHAKRLLDDRFTVLDATYEAGLSAPSRLHDLFLRWEAMTPGEYARNGKGLTIGWGWFDLSTILDDFSRYIIAWKLCTTMKASDVTDTLELALEASGCDQATVVHKPRLLSDNGSSYISGDLAEWLDDRRMEHVRGAP